jgi:hypothetical protein
VRYRGEGRLRELERQLLALDNDECQTTAQLGGRHGFVNRYAAGSFADPAERRLPPARRASPAASRQPQLRVA